MRIYKINDGETHWYVAKSEPDAVAMHAAWLKEYGFSESDIEESKPWSVRFAPNSEALTVNDYRSTGISKCKRADDWAASEEAGQLATSLV